MNKSKLIKKLLIGKELNFLEGIFLGCKSFNLPNPLYPIKYIIRGDSRRSDSMRQYVDPIQSIKENLVAKKRGFIDNGIFHESKMYRSASRNGVKTVDSKGIFNVYNVLNRMFETRLVTERAPGETLLEYDSKLIRKLKDDAIRYAEEKRYMVEDSNDSNVIFDKKTSKIYLIDLEQWKYNKKKAQN